MQLNAVQLYAQCSAVFSENSEAKWQPEQTTEQLVSLALCIEQGCTIYITHCTLYIVNCKLYYVHYTLYTV